jgi:ATP/maltotriose-dependent transcriptional regulator MalT
MIELAVDGMYRADLDAMLGWAERAVAAATSLQDRALTAAALAVRSCGAALSGTAAEAQAQCEEAAQLVDRLSDDELARRLDALVYLATAEGYLDRFEPSGRHGQRALTIGRATGQGDLFPLMYAVLGTALWVQGRIGESVEVLDGAVDAARLVDSDHGLAWNLCSRSGVAFAAGDLELASALVAESAELATRLDPGPVTAWIAVMRAQVLHEAGQAARAADLLVASAGGEELRMIGGAWRARCLELLTRCYLAAGRRAEAERSAEAARACANAVQLPLAAAMANLAEAALDIDGGSPASAARRAIDAAAMLEEVNAFFDAAGARLLAGRSLAQAGERDAAVAELERACAAFDSFGSVRYRAQAEQELRKLGRHIHRRTKAGAAGDAGVASLTARELELARLVVGRKTNPEIASELFLSQKTVETHLRNIFRKLGVANRIELARTVEAAEQAESPTPH